MTIEELKELRKKVLSLAAAMAIAATPVAANAAGNKNDKNTNSTKVESTVNNGFNLYEQIQVLNPITAQVFANLVKESYDELSRGMNVNTQKLECLSYLIFREFMPKTDAKDIEDAYAHNEKGANGKMQIMYDAYSVIGELLDYYQSTLQSLRPIEAEEISYTSYNKKVLNKYLTKVIKNSKYNLMDALRDYNKEVGKKHPEQMIDTGTTCIKADARLVSYLKKVIKDDKYDLNQAIADYNEFVLVDVTEKLPDLDKLLYADADKEIAKELKTLIIEAYKSVYGGPMLIENEAYIDLFKTLTTLNSAERKYNGEGLSVGGYFLLENIVGVSTVDMIYDYFLENYSIEELSQYFEYESILSKQWIVRKDVKIEVNALKNEIEVLINDLEELKVFAVKTVNNDMLSSLSNDCIEEENGNIK